MSDVLYDVVGRAVGVLCVCFFLLVCVFVIVFVFVVLSVVYVCAVCGVLSNDVWLFLCLLCSCVLVCVVESACVVCS